jgi:hypothetical protein
MKKAIEFDAAENLAVPINHVVAIVNSDDEAAVIAERLNKNGFSADEIGGLTGTGDSAKLDAATGKKGLFSKLSTTGADAGDRGPGEIEEFFRQMPKNWL